MRAVAVIGRDGPDPSRRAARREAHIAAIEAFARDGVLLLGLPLHSPQGRSEGSLMVVDVVALEDYLLREPFAAGGVWHDIACCAIEIPSLPWRAWPAPGAQLPPGRGHTILWAEGEADLHRLDGAAASGVLTFAARTCDRPGAILVTAHASDAAALAWAESDPLLRLCSLALHATQFRPLPYRPLP
ncbi:hypothetical protein [Roseomonas fluvialis]|uniref:YCII-related domain-containing protein n=1 Tax=Roseomonas fluvialis TaxID=1750527 RepID=A0ABN6P7M8_9PROT|nr:hypothetical protein [Roseomonas fluvialis]BDG74782.1 hypothetical protein Rmf_47110 [Roseomonas fluvialis]